MKKFYSIMLVACTMLLASFQAHGALTTTFKWNIPGAVEIYVGGTGATSKVNLPADATEYVATLDNTWGSAYVKKASGYEFESVTVGGTTLSPMSTGMVRVDMAEHNGATVNIAMEAIQYDAQFSINVVNGRDALVGYMWGTGREVHFKTGQQTVAYSSKYETGIDIQAPVEGSVDPVLKQDDIEMEWKAYYQWDTVLYHKYNGTSTKGFAFADGTDFYVKYCDTDDPAEQQEEKATVTLNFADADARAALQMLFNATKMGSISVADAFEVEKGDVIRLVFNAADYVVTINGTELVPVVNEPTVMVEYTVNADLTLNISVAEREYGTTMIGFYVADINGVVLHAGAYNGPVIDPATLSTGGSTTYRYQDLDKVSHTATVTYYSAEVSLKSPKVFIDPAEGYWMAASEYSDGSDKIDTGVATPEITPYVVNKKINATTPLVVYVKTSGTYTPDALALKDRNRNEYRLSAGYNEFMVDPEYASPFAITKLGIDDGVAVSVYQDMSSISYSEDNSNYSCSVTEPTVMHLFIGQGAPAQSTVSSYITPDAAGAKVTVDRLVSVASGTSAQTFIGCEVKVEAAGNEWSLDGVSHDEAEYTFTTSAVDHAIIVGNVTTMTITPADGAQVESLNNIVVSFPNATSGEVDTDLLGDIIVADLYSTYAGIRYNVEAVNGARVPTFRVTPQPLPSRSGTYRVYLPEGLFVLNGSAPSPESWTTFTIASQMTTEELASLINFDPVAEAVPANQFYGATIIIGEEPGEYSFTATEAMEGVTVTFGGQEWTRGSFADYDPELDEMGEADGDYALSVEGLYGIVSIVPLQEIVISEPTQLTVNIPAGAMVVDGAESPAITHTWTLIPAKEYSVNLHVGVEEVKSFEQLAELYISFPEAEKAEVANHYGVTLRHNGYLYHENATITPVENGQAPEGLHPLSVSNAPMFRLEFPTPDAEGSYTLNIAEGTFLLDDYFTSPAHTVEFSNTITGINAIAADATGLFTVTNLNGQVILRGVSAKNLRNLPAGIYIINGVKYLKK